MARRYKRDQKGRFAKTGSVRTPRPKKGSTPRKKATPKGTITSQQYAQREKQRVATKTKKATKNKGNIKKRSGKTTTELARMTGLKRSTVKKLQTQWKQEGVPKGLARRVNDPSYRRAQNLAAMKRGKGKARRKKR